MALLSTVGISTRRGVTVFYNLKETPFRRKLPSKKDLANRDVSEKLSCFPCVQIARSYLLLYPTPYVHFPLKKFHFKKLGVETTINVEHVVK
jgi:hypothetical protein